MKDYLLFLLFTKSGAPGIAPALVGALVAYLGYGRHGTWHGCHFNGGAKIAWKNLKSAFAIS